MGKTTQRTLDDRLGGLVRLARALDNDPTEFEPEHLGRLEEIEKIVALVRTHAVYAMREAGYTDSQLAQALGVSQQAVSKRWPGWGRYVGAAGRYRKPKGDQ